MNAKVVYQVAKALPKEEQKLLFEMLQEEFVLKNLKMGHLKHPALTKDEAFQYLLKNVFGNKIMIR